MNIKERQQEYLGVKGYWNGKVYGLKDNEPSWIYVDGEKVELTEEQYEKLSLERIIDFVRIDDINIIVTQGSNKRTQALTKALEAYKTLDNISEEAEKVGFQIKFSVKINYGGQSLEEKELTINDVKKVIGEM